jgi:hypothetical protein
MDVGARKELERASRGLLAAWVDLLEERLSGRSPAEVVRDTSETIRNLMVTPFEASLPPGQSVGNPTRTAPFSPSPVPRGGYSASHPTPSSLTRGARERIQSMPNRPSSLDGVC